MTTIRVAARERYTSVCNATIEDDRLTWEARGLLIYLLSKPDDWRVNRDHLAKQAPNGPTQIRRILKELTQAGYLVRRKRSVGTGFETETYVYESPVGVSAPSGSFSTSRKPTGRKPTSVVSTDVLSTEEVTTPLALVAEAPASSANSDEALFLAFYDAYGKKVAKNAAQKAWKAALKRGANPHQVIAAAKQFSDTPGRDPKFTPYPATWLNAGRYDDEHEDNFEVSYETPAVNYR